MLNYSAHCIPNLEKILEKSREKGNFEECRNLVWVIGQLRTAPKYVLPPNGIFFSNGEGLPPGLTPQRLPYPTIILEMPFDQSQPSNDITARSSKRIIICHEGSKLTHAFDPFSPTSPDMARDDADGYSVLNIAWYDDQRIWFPTVFTAFVEYDQVVTHLKDTDAPIVPSGRYPARTTKTAIGTQPGFLIPMVGREMIRRKGVAETLSAWANDISGEVRAAIEFLQVIACRNVKVHHQPAPAKLNQARTKKGKEPFDGYGLITIGDIVIGQSGSGSKSRPGYKVREHLRCGHIRRLADHQIWINDTIVAAGSTKGRTQRGYKIRR